MIPVLYLYNMFDTALLPLHSGIHDSSILISSHCHIEVG